MTSSLTNNQPAINRRTIIVASVIWLSCIAAFIPSLLDHMAKPGANAVLNLETWPSISPISPAEDGQTLLLFAHPQCPCTLATLAELERLLVYPIPTQFHAILVLPVPEDHAHNQATATNHSAVLNYASQIPGLTVTIDNEAEITRAFGIRTSGHCLLYGKDKTLLYSGGLTPLRGHEGPCEGNIALSQCLIGKIPASRYAPVFGCALYQGKQVIITDKS